MLHAVSDVAAGRGRLRTRLLLERRFRIQCVVHERVVFDSRFVVPAREPGASTVRNLYLVREGQARIDGGPVLDAPVGLGLAGDELDRIGPGSRTFRTFGARTSAAIVRLPGAACRTAWSLADGPLALPSALWASVDRVLAATDDGAALSGARALLGALEAAGLVDGAARGAIVDPEPPEIRALWTAVAPLYGRVDALATKADVEDASGASIRQLGRDLGELVRTFGLLGVGFRDASRVMRLRTAAILLGADDTTATEVARVVGYAGLDAMAQAFRQAGLPSPGEVRARLLS